MGGRAYRTYYLFRIEGCWYIPVEAREGTTVIISKTPSNYTTTLKMSKITYPRAFYHSKEASGSLSG
jgi:hypothetical protein